MTVLSDAQRDIFREKIAEAIATQQRQKRQRSDRSPSNQNMSEGMSENMQKHEQFKTGRDPENQTESTKAISTNVHDAPSDSCVRIRHRKMEMNLNLQVLRIAAIAAIAATAS